MAKAAQLDFTNVKDGGNFNKKHQKAGDYKAKIMKVDDVTKKDDKSIKMWLWTIKVGTGTYPYYTTHTGEGAEKQLWKIRNLFVAAGKNVPKKRLKVDPNSIVGSLIGVTLEDEEYNDRMQSSIGATFPPSELEGTTSDDDDDEEDEEEDDEEESEDEEDEEDEEDSEDEDEEEDEEEEEDDEEEEEPEPPKKKKKAKPAKEEPKKKGKKKTSKVDDDELEELDIEDI